MDKTLYDRDFYQWLTETAFLLAEGRLSEIASNPCLKGGGADREVARNRRGISALL